MLTLTDRAAADTPVMSEPNTTPSTSTTAARPQRPDTAEARADVTRWTSEQARPVPTLADLYGEPKIIDCLPLMETTARRTTTPNPVTTVTVNQMLLDLGAAYRSAQRNAAQRSTTPESATHGQED